MVILIVGTTRLTKVLMDEGSGLNILYASTLNKIGIPWISQRPIKAPFYGIMLGKEAMPLGRIRLNVTFDVVDFPNVYHYLLGRPCFAKFMVIPNYTYLKLKMPSPKGVIIVKGSFKQAYYCKKDCVAQASVLIAPCDLDGLDHDTGRAPMEEAAKAVAVLG